MPTVKVSDLLAHPFLAGTKVLAGEGGLRQTARSVFLVRSLSPAPPPPHAVVVADGSLFVGQETYLAPLIALCRRSQAAALALGLVRGLERLPAEAQAAADEGGPAVLQVPGGMRVYDWAIAAANALIEIQEGGFQQAQRLGRRLMDLVLGGYGSDRVAATLAGVVRNPVIFTDAGGAVVALGLPPELEPIRPPFEVTATPYEQVEAALAQNYAKWRGRPGREPQREQELRSFKRTVTAAGRPVGALRVLELTKAVEQNEIAALEDAVTAFALDAAKQIAVQEVERRSRTQFVEDLVSGRLVSEQDVRLRMNLLGWRLKMPAAILAIDIERFGEWQQRSESEARVQEKKAEMYRAVDLYLQRQGLPPAVGLRSDSLIVVIFGAASVEETVAQARKIKAVCDKALKDLIVSVGVGNPRSALADLKDSHAEAWQSLELGRRLWGPGRVTHVADLGAFRLLARLSRPQLRSLALTTLGPLGLAGDEAEELRRTVAAYLRSDGSINEAAAILGVHRNTVKYRLAKVWGAGRPGFGEKVNLFLALLANSLALTLDPDDAEGKP